ncbi:MAG: hypothetical protein L0Y71_22150 [Gemmataceae bacterium]|nr:hypothetical protein [Gemmataceae bacterium]
MKPPGFIEKLDDAINPIVVKELRQAVRSRFVVAVVLLFLLLQLAFLGIYLTIAGLNGWLDTIDYQAGRDVFTWLQVILLATCMLFLPAYAGARLAAERSEVNTDLLFITTLQPRKIISGKLASSVVIAVMIFSACAPFMAFTYFLRGIDLVSIFFVIAIDFLVVLGSVHLMVFLAVIPANRVLKAFLGVIGFAMLLFIFGMTLAATISLVHFGLSPMLENREFWSICATVVLEFVGECGLLYTWAVALISAPSANRILPMRVFMLAFGLISGLAHAFIAYSTQQEEPFQSWILFMGQMTGLALFIAVNERQSWTPRVSRTIPRNPLLRVPAFLFYSGAAGGVLFAGLLFGVMALGVWLFKLWHPLPVAPVMGTITDEMFNCMAVVLLYIYCYGMTAVLVRSWLMPGVQHVYTWVVMLFLIALGSLAPFLVSALIFMGGWNYHEHFVWVLGNPGFAIYEFVDRKLDETAYVYFAGAWAALVTLLNVVWFFRQMRAFRPFEASHAPTVLPAGSDSSSVTLPVSKL